MDVFVVTQDVHCVLSLKGEQRTYEERMRRLPERGCLVRLVCELLFWLDYSESVVNC